MINQEKESLVAMNQKRALKSRRAIPAGWRRLAPALILRKVPMSRDL
jgi:hypothetical protein